MQFPNETSKYRSARNRLLDAEHRLRKQGEQVAVLRTDWHPKLDYRG